MQKIILFILFEIFSLCMFAQRTAPVSTLTPPITISPNIIDELFKGQHFNSNYDATINGTPFMFGDWKNGQVITDNGNKFFVSKINFDASRSVFVFLKNDSLYDVDEKINEIIIYKNDQNENKESNMVFQKNILPDLKNFIQVLVQGNITIVRKFNKQVEGENYTNGIVTNKKEYVLHFEDYAIVNNKLVSFNYNNNGLNDLVGNKASAINAYVKLNNLKLKKQSDFLKSIEYYNSLN